MVMGVNIYFIILNFSSPLVYYIMLGFIVINIVFSVFSGILYLYRFRNKHNKGSILTGVHDINLVKQAIIEEENIFSKFFNQITTNYFLFILITVIYTYYLMIEK